MSKKVKTFFHVFTKSLIPQPEYYRKIVRSRLSFSLKYFISLSALIYLFFVFILLLKINPIKLIQWKTNVVDNLTKYPDDLVINVENGNLITTYNRPYFFWLNDIDKKNLLLVIDQTALPDKILKYRSVFLLTGNSFVTRKNDAITAIPFKNLSFKIDKNVISNALNGLTVGLSLILFSIFILLLLIILPIIVLSLNLFYVLISGFFIFIIYRFFSHKIPYKKILQLSFHSSTIPLLIGYCLCKLNPFALFFLIVIFLGVGVYEVYFDKSRAKISQ
jgi:hypothetical protein